MQLLRASCPRLVHTVHNNLNSSHDFHSICRYMFVPSASGMPCYLVRFYWEPPVGVPDHLGLLVPERGHPCVDQPQYVSNLPCLPLDGHSAYATPMHIMDYIILLSTFPPGHPKCLKQLYGFAIVFCNLHCIKTTSVSCRGYHHECM